MKINYSVLREGDVFFTGGNDFLARLIRWATGSKVSHCGQLIKPYGGDLFYKCEMGKYKDGKDLKFNPIKGNEIVSIKRPLKYNKDKIHFFRKRMLYWHEKITYDGLEFLSHIPVLGWKKDFDKEKMICSRLVFTNLVLMDVPIDCKKFRDAVTPDDLYRSPALFEVEGWKNG